MFLDEQVLDRSLDGSLAFCEERLKVVWRERVTEQDVERGGRNEVGLEGGRRAGGQQWVIRTDLSRWTSSSASRVYWVMTDVMARRLTETSTPSWRSA